MGLIGFIVSLVIAALIVAVVEAVSRTEVPYGWLGNIVVGFIGGILGQYILGNTWGPSLFGVLIIQTFIGALVLILVAKAIMSAASRNRTTL